MRGLPNTPVEWVKNARSGNEQAIADIYNLLWKPSVMFVYYELGAQPQLKQTAEDMASEKLVYLLQKLQKNEIKGDDNFSGYYYKALKNVLVDYYKGSKKNRPYQTFSDYDCVDFDDSFEDSIQNGEGLYSSCNLVEFQPEENVDYTIIKEGVQECLANLPEKQRTALYLYYYEKMSISDICEEFDAKENTVKGWLYYGRNNIKEQIERLRKENKSFYGILPIPFLLWVFKETSSMFVSKNAALVASQIVVGTKTPPIPKKGVSHAAVKTSTHIARTGLVKVAIAGAIGVGAIGGGYLAIVKHNETSNEQISEVVEDYPYQPGVYDMNSVPYEYDTVYTEPSFDSKPDHMIQCTEQLHLFVTKEIVKGDDGNYWAKLKGGYVCLSKPHGKEGLDYTFVKEVPTLASDYSEDLFGGYLIFNGGDSSAPVEEYAKACETETFYYGMAGTTDIISFEDKTNYDNFTTDCTPWYSGGNDNLMYY